MMKKFFMFSLFCFIVSAVVPALSIGQSFKSNIIEEIRIKDADVPAGFVYGQIPTFAKKVLKGNPWNMDIAAINRLAKNIYPDGDAASIMNMHVSILAEKSSPYGDDIVCYIILFKSETSAKKEIHKLTEYVRNNSDRALLINKGNLAVFLHVDDVKHFDLIQNISEKMSSKIKM